MELQLVLNTYATDVFRKQADCDYIAARASFRMQLRQQFLWSALQSLEKYFKAILLFNGKSARYRSGTKKEFGHDLEALLVEVKGISIFSLDLDSEHELFIRYVSEQGKNRYLAITAYNTGQVLRQLDTTVWHLRRYCQFMPDRGLGSPSPVPGLREAHVKAVLSAGHKQKPQGFRVSGGELEKILKRPPSDPARRALVWSNLYYGAKRRTMVSYRTFSSSEVPPRESRWEGVDWKLVDTFIKP